MEKFFGRFLAGLILFGAFGLALRYIGGVSYDAAMVGGIILAVQGIDQLRLEEKLDAIMQELMR
jgi:hypothetical protein